MGVIISDGLDWVCSTWKTQFQILGSFGSTILRNEFVCNFFLNLAFFDLPKIYFSTDLMFEFQH